MATSRDEFRDFVLDQLDGLHGVTYRAMFGSYGLYHWETFFGVIHKGRLYFKVTPETVALYKRNGMKPFQPNKKQTLSSFYEVPVAMIEDGERLTTWALQAISSK